MRFDKAPSASTKIRKSQLRHGTQETPTHISAEFGVYIAKVRTESLMDMVAYIVQILPNSDNELK
jgi:hypothetical protein